MVVGQQGGEIEAYVHWGGKVGGRGDGYILVGKRTVRKGGSVTFSSV